MGDGEGGHPGGLHDQDTPEASDESRQEGDVRQGRRREGQAGQDDREGLPRRRPQEERLRSFVRFPLLLVVPLSATASGRSASVAREGRDSSACANLVYIACSGFVSEKK